MGQTLDKPITEKYNESNCRQGIRYGLSSMQGWRSSMEDSHSALISIPTLGDNISWFAVFDGHNGSNISSHCSSHLLEAIISNKTFVEAVKKQMQLSIEEFQKKVTDGIISAFLQFDKKMQNSKEILIKNPRSSGGSTAICAFITDKYIIICNCGDSRGVLSGRDITGDSSYHVSRPILATADHKPSEPIETKRIEQAGGNVYNNRINGHLAVSRALGDFEYKDSQSFIADLFSWAIKAKPQLVTAEPDIYIKQRDPVADEFVVLACDGIWDVMSNEELVQFISSRMKITDDLEIISNEVVDACLGKGSQDNQTIIIIAFPEAPKLDEEAQKKDKALVSLIQRKIEELVSVSNCFPPYIGPSICYDYIVEILFKEELPDLPPGGGLYSKRQIMMDIYDAACMKNHEDLSSADNE